MARNPLSPLEAALERDRARAPRRIWNLMDARMQMLVVASALLAVVMHAVTGGVPLGWPQLLWLAVPAAAPLIFAGATGRSAGVALLASMFGVMYAFGGCVGLAFAWLAHDLTCLGPGTPGC